MVNLQKNSTPKVLAAGAGFFLATIGTSLKNLDVIKNEFKNRPAAEKAEQASDIDRVALVKSDFYQRIYGDQLLENHVIAPKFEDAKLEQFYQQVSITRGALELSLESESNTRKLDAYWRMIYDINKE